MIYDPNCFRCHGTGKYDFSNGVPCCLRCELPEVQAELVRRASRHNRLRRCGRNSESTLLLAGIAGIAGYFIGKAKKNDSYL